MAERSSPVVEIDVAAAGVIEEALPDALDAAPLPDTLDAVPLDELAVSAVAVIAPRSPAADQLAAVPAAPAVVEEAGADGRRSPSLGGSDGRRSPALCLDGFIDGYSCKTCDTKKKRKDFANGGIHCTVCHSKWRAMRGNAVVVDRNEQLKKLKKHNFAEATEFMQECMEWNDPDKDFPFAEKIDALMQKLHLIEPVVAASAPSAHGSSSPASSSGLPRAIFREEIITSIDTRVSKRTFDQMGNLINEEEVERTTTNTITEKRRLG